jgi:O-acetyl-ADP-ribose deacetylase (regulator of RNase III)
MMETIINHTKVLIVQGDITEQSVDAIVNAANPTLMGGGGVDGAIHRAGGPAILEECKRIIANQGPLAPGKAVISTGGRLKARYVIHTVGPIWHGGASNEANILASAYRECLKVAADKKLTSLAFPSISTGAYGYPLGQASGIAMDSVGSFLRELASTVNRVVFVLFDSKTYQSYCFALQQLIETAE